MLSTNLQDLIMISKLASESISSSLSPPSRVVLTDAFSPITNFLAVYLLLDLPTSSCHLILPPSSCHAILLISPSHHPNLLASSPPSNSRASTSSSPLHLRTFSLSRNARVLTRKSKAWYRVSSSLRRKIEGQVGLVLGLA